MCNQSCVRVCVSSRTPSPMDPTVSLPSDAGDEDTAVAVETTSKSSDQRQSSQEVEGELWGEGWQGIRLHNNQGEERYQPSKAEVGEPNVDNDCFGSGRLQFFANLRVSLILSVVFHFQNPKTKKPN